MISRFRNRSDKLEQREVYKLEGRVVERFSQGREDKLAEVSKQCTRKVKKDKKDKREAGQRS